MDDQTIENEIQRKGLTAPRITPADIEEAIAHEVYFTAADGVVGASPEPAGDVRNGVPDTLHRLTFCTLVLLNGYTVTGESSCVSAENFDAELGRKIARQKAKDKIWALEGYRLRDQLFRLAS